MIRRAVPSALLVLALTACGVPTDDRPRAAQVPPGPFPAPVTASTAAPAGQVDEVLCFVRDDRIVPVIRRVDVAPGADAQLRHLLAGPIQAERDTGLTSALPGAVADAGVVVGGGEAVVEVRGAGDDTGRSDEVLAFGQIVCTLTARDAVEAVSFRSGGQPLDVPRADGSLSRQPLTAADYLALTRDG